jgi:membrane carboxypeptidase/penicillin-binding protein
MESRLHGPSIEVDAPYVAEMVRNEMQAKYGDAVYTAGYKVFTTIDSRLQAAATVALRTGLLGIRPAPRLARRHRQGRSFQGEQRRPNTNRRSRSFLSSAACGLPSWRRWKPRAPEST